MRFYIKIIISGISKVITLNLKGKNSIHVRYISVSYRIRGKVARNHTYIVAIANVLIIRNKSVKIGDIPVKNTTDRRLIIKMFAYSAIKIKANKPLLYSVLNPETSSDSPSAKSNGVRLVSARLVISQMAARGEIKIIGHVREEAAIIDISICFLINSVDRRISDILTSYEIVCATPRKAPNRAYLELEHQPARNVVYTFILDTHRKYSTPNDIYTAVWECG